MVVDFTLEMFKHLGDDIPACRSGKFIVFSHASEYYFVMALLKQCVNHKDILERFCESNALPFDPSCSPPQSSAIQMHGGGYFEVFEDEKRLAIGASSLDYGVFDKVKTNKILRDDHVFSAYQISGLKC